MHDLAALSMRHTVPGVELWHGERGGCGSFLWSVGIKFANRPVMIVITIRTRTSGADVASTPLAPHGIERWTFPPSTSRKLLAATGAAADRTLSLPRRIFMV